MITALFIIGSAAALVLLAARLREARDEIERLQAEREFRDQAAREEHAVYDHAVAMTLTCLLAGLAASWYIPADRSAADRTGAREGAPAGGPDGRDAR